MVRRRTVLATLVLGVAGCVDRSSTDNAESSDPPADAADNDTTDDDASTTADSGAETTDETDTETETERMEHLDEYGIDDSRVADLERLPDRNPLVTTLRDLYVVEDADSFAAARDSVELDGNTVEVRIDLESDAALPEGYVQEESYSGEGMVVGYVPIADLVALALEEDVRLVQLPPEQETH